jgi:hypothetical protein
MLLTLSEITYKFGIYLIKDKSYKSLPHKLRFLIPKRLSFRVLVNIKSFVRALQLEGLLTIELRIFSLVFNSLSFLK